MRQRNLVITGVPRSGTSLVSVCINHFPDAVSLNEVFNDVRALPAFFAETREAILGGRPVKNKYDAAGRLTTNTLEDRVTVARKVVDKPLRPDFILALKSPGPFLFNIEKIARYDCPILAVVRDPVETLSSWHRPNVASVIPVAKMTADPRSTIAFTLWSGLQVSLHPNAGETVYDRRARLWNCFATLLADLGDRLILLRYEDLVEQPMPTLAAIATKLDTPPPEDLPAINATPPSQRIDASDVRKIRAAVQRHCPMRTALGY